MAESEYTMRETAAYYAQRVENITDAARANDWKLTLRDVVGLDCARAFLSRVARGDLDVFAPESTEQEKP